MKESEYNEYSTMSPDTVASGLETFDPQSRSVMEIHKLSKSLVDVTGDRRAGNYRGQRISLAIQKKNAGSIFRTFVLILVLFLYVKFRTVLSELNSCIPNKLIWY